MSKNLFFFRHKEWLWPLIALALLTPFTPFLDLSISRYFFVPPHSFSSNSFYTFLYHYGVIPGQVLFGFSAAALLLASLSSRWKKWQAPALALVMSLLIGGGLIVHEMFKEHWGRPRPRQVVEFGGLQPFRPYYEPNFFHQPEPSKGFSCGHCTMGFYFFSAALTARRLQYRKTFWASLFLAFSLGVFLSLARIAEGGHFFSDTLVSALVMWLTAYTCDCWLKQKIRDAA